MSKSVIAFEISKSKKRSPNGDLDQSIEDAFVKTDVWLRDELGGQLAGEFSFSSPKRVFLCTEERCKGATRGRVHSYGHQSLSAS